MNLNDNFNESLLFGFDIRKNNEDGKTGWRKIEEKYLSSDGYIDLSENYKNILNSINITYSDEQLRDLKLSFDDIVISNSVESEHFIIQIFRIPILYKNILPYVKFMQIAYNIGQMIACMNENMYSQKIVNFIKKNKLLDIETFI
jgi:hypothetical protein